MAPGQFFRGSIVGTITDPSGASIPGVRVSLTNQGTNELRETYSDQRGGYTLPALLPGLYTIETLLESFQTRVVKEIKLDVNQTARIDLTLEVGQVVERIEVTAPLLLLKQDSSEVGHVITNKQIVDLPLNGRDYLQLARLIPGATPSRAGATLARKGVNRSVNVAGARDTSVAFLVDGIDANDISFQIPTITPSIDTIQEFKLLQNSYTAEFGQGATQIIVSLKSGTNNWHGSLFEFHRNDKIAARSFFQPGKPGKLIQNQFGGSLGGPIVRDRTFFFVNYEGQRIRSGGASFGQVPTARQKAGDFSEPGDPQIFDPLTFDADTQTRQPFPNSVIPSDRMSDIGVKAASIWPDPNFSGTGGRNFTREPLRANDNDQGNVRVDHRLTDKDNVFGRYSIRDAFGTRPSLLPAAGSFDEIRGQNAALNWTRTFGPSLLNEVRIGFNRAYNSEKASYDGEFGDNPALEFFGFQNTAIDPDLAFGLPAFSFTDGFLGIRSKNALIYLTQRFQFVDNFTLVKGAHTVKAGVDIRRQRFKEITGGNERGGTSFQRRFSSQPGQSRTGSSVADLLMGFPRQASLGGGDRIATLRNRLLAGYVQDDWKISSRFTLNLGLRYEYVSPWSENLNGLSVLDLEATNGGQVLLAGTSKAWIPGVGTVDSGKPPIPSTIIPRDLNNFAPRFGFAFRPFSKTVIRGGYGIFFDIQEGNETKFLFMNPPKTFSTSQTAGTFVPDVFLDNLFGPLVVRPEGFIGRKGANVRTVDPGSMRTPYLQQWNLNIQRELVSNLLLEVGYLGTKGTHLLRRSNFQQGPDILVKDPANPAPLRKRVRFPNFGISRILGTENAAASNYHGLTAKIDRRFANGLGLLFGYTYSRTIDNAHSSSNFSNQPQNPQCRCDLKSEKGPSAFHIKQRAVFSYTYELPFGKSGGGALNKVIGGWQLNGIVAVQSGPATTINTAGDNASIGRGSGSANNQRPNLVGEQFGGIDTGAPITTRGVDAGTTYFNTAAFVLPPQFRLGNLGKGTLYGPGLANWDFSVFKNTKIGEKVTTQFRAEFFNILNKANFGGPGRFLGRRNFGVITGAGSGRIIQLGLKILF